MILFGKLLHMTPAESIPDRLVVPRYMDCGLCVCSMQPSPVQNMQDLDENFACVWKRATETLIGRAFCHGDEEAKLMPAS